MVGKADAVLLLHLITKLVRTWEGKHTLRCLKHQVTSIDRL